MQIPVIIMAGGKSNRFNFNNINIKYREKPLLPYKNKYIIEHIIDGLLNSNNINRVIVAVSPHTPHTKIILKKRKLPIELLNTPGRDYHFDIVYIIKSLNLNITMTISADLPLIKPYLIDDIIEQYFILNKPALSLMSSIDIFNKYKLKPTCTFKTKRNEKVLVPLGINIIDGRLIDQKDLEQAIVIVKDKEFLFNINTIDDYYKLLNL